MSDLIDRKNAIDVLQILADKMTDEGRTVMAQAISVLRDLSSAEPERTAKAKVNFKDENYFFGWCECGQYQSSQFPYCPACGCRLEWE